ncbi:tetratricopeptide repeat protein [Phycisphaera mikurensis]|uniref:Tetratricopeptide repeat protein n=1 Tax=Phycisphaera mikurensis (strain NBRC 102666 / KCTC 22515 / FYK2301M01) TaxID=1142394 RepID=I0IGK6_PHYMF|nr:tetratricopeptide repeat protein [Phycisphaera mikurensis]MBB6442924.1 tetratricopeptide (TPR) repeat protein [Phycisphaera mikurensis]BAM04394.1 hypothetical protein PSMK_22350 [Phycisphaera mikurensis NBRC 102666]
MAASVNKTFVAILVAVLVAVVGLAGGVYWKLYHRTADQLRVEGEKHLIEARRHAAEVDSLEGDAALQSYRRSGEEYEQATSLFGQAFTREPTNLEILQNYIDSLSQMHAPNRIRAQEFHQELLAKRKLAVELSGDQPERLDAYFESLMAMVPWAGEGVYQAVFREAEQRLATNPDDAISRKYRAIVGTHRLNESTDLTEQRAILDDVERALEESPDDPELHLAMARYQLFEAGRVELDDAAFDAAMQAAIEAIEAATPGASEDRTVLLGQNEARLRALRMLRTSAARAAGRGVAAARIEALTARADQLEAQLAEEIGRLEASIASDPTIDDLVRTADLLTAVDREAVVLEGDVASTGGLKRTEALVRRAIASEPLNVSYKVMLGNLLRLRQQHDEALTVYREADALEAVGPAEMMLRSDARRRQARFEIASIELIKAEAASDPAERERLLKGAEEAVDELVNAEQRTARVLLLEGKIALLRKQTTRAMQSLDRAVQMYADAGQPNVEAILLSARARQSEQQYGAAAERLEELLRAYPLERSPSTEQRIRRQLAEIYLASNRPQEAAGQVDRLAEIAAEDASVAALRGQVALQNNEPDKAAAVFEAAGLMGNPGIVRRLAQAYRANGRPEEATGLLSGFLDANPADPGVLAELMPALDEDARASRIAAAEAAGLAEETAMLLRGSSDPADRQRLVDSLAARDGGGIEEQLRRATLWERLEEPEKAAAAYDRARAIDPNHPRVLLEDLRIALEAGEIERARRLASTASEENLDLAGGRFIRGQVAAAQGDTGTAIVLYKEGLRERPIYDQGWKTLGDLHLREGDPNQAADAYSQATRQRPDNVGALLGLAESQRMRGREGAALAALREAVSVVPENAGVRERYLAYEIARGDAERALAFRRERAAQRPDDAGNQLALARLLVDRQRPAEAFEVLDALDAAGDVGVTRASAATRASLLAEVRGDDEGIASFRGYLAERGEAAEAADYSALGRLLAAAGEADEALAAYQRAAEMESPDDPRRAATRELGDYLFASGDPVAAAAVYRDLLASDALAPEDRQRIALRQAETLVRAGDAPAAEALLKDQEPTAESELLVAMIASGRGDAEAARASVERALQLNPESSAAYLQRALLPGADPQQALADAERAASLDPGDAAAGQLRTELLLRLGRREEATAALRERLDQNPGDVRARVRLAELRAADGERDDAERLIEAGRRLDPDNPVWDRFARQLAASSPDAATATAALEAMLAESGDPAVLARLARRHLDGGDDASALAALDGSPALVQESPELQAIRGRALAAGGDTEGARNVLRLAAERSRGIGELGGVLNEAAAVLDPEEAVTLAEAAPSTFDEASLELVQAAVLMNHQRWGATVALLEAPDAASRDAEGDLLARRDRSLATSLQSLGRAEEAKARYEALLAEQPEDVGALNNLAYLLAVDLDRPGEAVPLAERARDALSQGVPPVQRAAVLDTLGWAQHLAGDETAARATLEESLRLAPIPAAHLHLARVYRAIGLDTLADDQARRARSLASERGDAAVLEEVEAFEAAAG